MRAKKDRRPTGRKCAVIEAVANNVTYRGCHPILLQQHVTIIQDVSSLKIRSFYIDPTCLFVDEILDNTAPDLATVESTAEYIANALEKVRVSSGGNISTSTSALLHVMLDACYNENMSKKVIGRLDTWQEISEKCTGTTEFPLVSSDKEQSDAIQEQG